MGGFDTHTQHEAERGRARSGEMSGLTQSAPTRVSLAPTPHAHLGLCALRAQLRAGGPEKKKLPKTRRTGEAFSPSVPTPPRKRISRCRARERVAGVFRFCHDRRRRNVVGDE